jgi:hypothetical protein
MVKTFNFMDLIPACGAQSHIWEHVGVRVGFRFFAIYLSKQVSRID